MNATFKEESQNDYIVVFNPAMFSPELRIASL